MILHIQTKTYYSYPFLDNGISSFYHSYSNNGNSLHDQQQHLNEPPSYSFTDSNYPQSQGSNLYTIVETETKVSLKPPFIKRILVVDDDPDITLTFKAGLDGHYYGDGDKKKSFEVYTYNDHLLVLKEFNSYYYHLLLTALYTPNIPGL